MNGEKTPRSASSPAYGHGPNAIGAAWFTASSVVVTDWLMMPSSEAREQAEHDDQRRQRHQRHRLDGRMSVRWPPRPLRKSDSSPNTTRWNIHSR